MPPNAIPFLQASATDVMAAKGSMHSNNSRPCLCAHIIFPSWSLPVAERAEAVLLKLQKLKQSSLHCILMHSRMIVPMSIFQQWYASYSVGSGRWHNCVYPIDGPQKQSCWLWLEASDRLNKSSWGTAATTCIQRGRYPHDKAVHPRLQVIADLFG